MKFDRQIQLRVRTSSTPPSQQYIGSMEVNNLRISFSILKTLSPSVNTAQIRVWNLNQNKRNELNNYGNEIKLLAGYRQETGPQLLFQGQSRLVNHTFNGTDIISSFDCGDGEKNFNLIVDSSSFGANTSAFIIISYYATKLGMEIINPLIIPQKTYANGFKHVGQVKIGLQKVCDFVGLVPSVQNGNLLLTLDSLGRDFLPFEINSDTGMIGTPERNTDRKGSDYRAITRQSSFNPGWKVTTLLRPDIIPGDRIRLRSRKVDIDGVFKVFSIRHIGDNYGDIFQSTFEVVP